VRLVLLIAVPLVVAAVVFFTVFTIEREK